MGKNKNRPRRSQKRKSRHSGKSNPPKKWEDIWEEEWDKAAKHIAAQSPKPKKKKRVWSKAFCTSEEIFAIAEDVFGGKTYRANKDVDQSDLDLLGKLCDNTHNDST